MESQGESGKAGSLYSIFLSRVILEECVFVWYILYEHEHKPTPFSNHPRLRPSCTNYIFTIISNNSPASGSTGVLTVRFGNGMFEI